MHHLHNPNVLINLLQTLQFPTQVLIVDIVRPGTIEDAIRIRDTLGNGQSKLYKQDLFNSLCAALDEDEMDSLISTTTLNKYVLEHEQYGKIVFISDTVHPDTRTVAIRTAVNNPKFELKPQMLASLVLKGQTVRQLAVPASAVVLENGREYVFVQLDKLRFRLTEVRLDPAVGDYRPVIKGLDEATPIVVDGTFHLNSQRKRAELE
jgi:multidrug efflux pump subunit AcrA (membrane-fusion protein)